MFFSCVFPFLYERIGRGAFYGRHSQPSIQAGYRAQQPQFRKLYY